ncbi:hypothetical protein [Micromonospora sp. NPDC049662]|uniref:hypothetical protein n=1 Tax=Micromonospora sp. NPDC049662 TaxID=3155397 RepID=UPI003412350D
MSITQNARPAVNGTGGEQVGETSRQPTRMPAGWHEQADWEAEHAYAEGYAAGWAAAERAIADEITEAVGVQPYKRGDVIRGLIRSIGQVPSSGRPAA